MTPDARQAAESVARASYGRLVAMLVSRSRDIAAAEDALADAFRAALETWPARGVPSRPEAWLLVAARRALGHGRRHDQVRHAATATLERLREERESRRPNPLGDDRLKLLFVCAHPAVDEAVRTPLMLQTVLGLDAARIAAAFVVAPATMAQRLARAKARIRDAGIRFETPEREDLADRLDAVLSAVYAAFGSGWDAPGGPSDLTAEAIFLARLLVQLLPAEPEARGLLALMLYCEARAPARRTRAGAFVPLERQDTALWSRDLIVEAENQLTLASRAGAFGRFQTEAAIQSVHVQRAITGRTNHAALVALYDLLVARVPSVGARVARAAVHGAAFGPARGLALLEAIEVGATKAYQPYWVARAHLLGASGQAPDARAAYRKAIALTAEDALRDHLVREAESLAKE